MHPGVERDIAQRLRELPSEMTPPLSWEEIAQEVRAARAAGRQRFSRSAAAASRRALALAACLVLLVVALAVWKRFDGLQLQGPAGRIAQTRITAPVTEHPGSSESERAVRVAADERWLASVPDENGIVHVSTRIAVVGLEDRIASLDDLLNAARLRNVHADRLRELQVERARLVDSLVQVRYAETLAAQP
jgi:hypothetical protein